MSKENEKNLTWSKIASGEHDTLKIAENLKEDKTMKLLEELVLKINGKSAPKKKENKKNEGENTGA